MRLAILDDYQGVAASMVDWASISGVSVVPFRDHVHDADELVARLTGFDAVMRIRERTSFTRDILRRLPQLKLILATGMRNARSLDLTATDDLGITVCTTDALHQTTVEVTWALILSLTRNLPRETGALRHGGWQQKLGKGLGGRTLGIVGLGNMGIPVSQIARIFGMKVIAWSRNLTPERTAPHGVECVTKEELFRRSDVITLHLPLSDTTDGTVGAAEIALMKHDAVIINTARPQLMDEAALVAALKEGRIGGAGLDVFEIEPLPADHPFRTLPNVVATPHIGFVTEENMRMFYEQSLANLAAFRAGTPINVISANAPFLPDSQVAQQMHAQKLGSAELYDKHNDAA
ncbi:MAG: D-2-hydroxyacid dehydrogenase family protein [Rhizobiaceae bacterium]|nr:D-2-hydroxyacid dehydrogenase family protein [Rhizobiaceae bacterium]